MSEHTRKQTSENFNTFPLEIQCRDLERAWAARKLAGYKTCSHCGVEWLGEISTCPDCQAVEEAAQEQNEIYKSFVELVDEYHTGDAESQPKCRLCQLRNKAASAIRERMKG